TFVILVTVNTDYPNITVGIIFLNILCFGEYTVTGISCRMINNVNITIKHIRRYQFPFIYRIEILCILYINFNIWIHGFYSGNKTSFIFTSASKSASYLLISYESTPPRKPTLSVFVLFAAATPAKKEPSCSAYVKLATLSPSAILSTMAN